MTLLLSAKIQKNARLLLLCNPNLLIFASIPAANYTPRPLFQTIIPMAILEVCCGDFRSVLNAKSAGAPRVELCAALSEGGLTPSWGLLRQAMQVPGIAKHVLIRVREGDFCYSSAEIEIMLADIEQAKQLGADGVVVGALLPNGKIDILNTQRMIEAARPMSVTFHRAFDRSDDLLQNLEILIELGVDRVLTSGGAPTAWEGREMLRKLVNRAAGRIQILVGAGVTAENGVSLLHATAARELHGSLSETVAGGMAFSRSTVKMGAGEAENDQTKVASVKKITCLLEEMRKNFGA